MLSMFVFHPCWNVTHWYLEARTSCRWKNVYIFSQFLFELPNPTRLQIINCSWRLSCIEWEWKKTSRCNLICSLIRIEHVLTFYIFLLHFHFYFLFLLHVHVSSFVIGFSWLLDILSLDIGSTIDVRLSKLLHIGQNQRQVKAKPSTLDFLLKKQSLDVPNANKVT